MNKRRTAMLASKVTSFFIWCWTESPARSGSDCASERRMEVDRAKRGNTSTKSRGAGATVLLQVGVGSASSEVREHPHRDGSRHLDVTIVKISELS